MHIKILDDGKIYISIQRIRYYDIVSRAKKPNPILVC